MPEWFLRGADPERVVFFVVLAALACGALIAVGLLGHLLWLAERQRERGEG